MKRVIASKAAALLIMAVFLGGSMPVDTDNPTCPAEPNWGSGESMTLTPVDRNGMRVLLAEGRIDEALAERLKDALDSDPAISEIWLRSRGGNARAGNEAGRVIRSYPGLVTRVPKGWTCFSACNFVFMGGMVRFVDDGGIFMVHMFTHTNDRWIIEDAVIDGSQATTELIASIEQSSALLATEDNDFLIRMGISRDLLTDVMYQQQAVQSEEDTSTRYCLNPDELLEYNVINGAR